MWNLLKSSFAPAQPSPTKPQAQTPTPQQSDTPQELVSRALKHASANEFGHALALIKPLRPLFHPTHSTSDSPPSTSPSSSSPPSSSPPSSSSSLSPLRAGEQVRLAQLVADLDQLVRRKLEPLRMQDESLPVCQACQILSFLQSLQPDPSTENEGLEIYLDFLEKIIHKDATEFMKVLVEESDTTASASILADLFSLTGSIIHDSLPLMVHFSSDGVNKLVSRANKQCSVHAANIFELFSEELNLADTVQQIQSYRHVPVENDNPLIANPLQLDETLQTISLMCAYATRYGKNPAADCNHLQASIQVMLGNYLALESFYLEHALSEAIETQQALLVAKAQQDIAAHAAALAANSLAPPSPSGLIRYNSGSRGPGYPSSSEVSEDAGEALPQTSTQVDDAFFILKKCLKRGLATLAANVACAIVNSASMVLDQPYFSSLQILCDKVSSQPTDVLLELLNDLELSSEYIVKLHRELTTDVDRLFAVASEKTKLHACLDDMTKSATNACNRLRKKNLSLNYDLDEVTYEQAEINDPFLIRLLQELQDLLRPAKTLLRPLNRSDLALLLATLISTKFENAALAKKFTLLGAVQFSKEIRQLADYFVALGGQPLRYQFTRLAQISQLLNLDRVIDCMEYWIEGKSVFKLSVEEVRQVLMRRIDFSIDSINALKL